MSVTLAYNLKHRDKMFIGGAWVKPSSTSMVDIINPVTEELTTRFALADSEDMDRAIASARDAFDNGPWPRMSPPERAVYIRAIADGIRARAPQFGALFSAQSGVASAEAEYASLWGAQRFDYYADQADKYPFIEKHDPSDGAGKLAMLVREPVGVVGAIISWNSGVTLIGAKLGAALLAGCTVVFKASPESPGDSWLFAEVLEEVGLPPGVVNVVTARREASDYLIRDPRIDKISFTGSTSLGQRVASIMGERIGRFGLELGGKSAAVIFDDYDLSEAAEMLALAGTRLTGQSCTNLTRIIVTAGRYEEFVKLLSDAMARVKVGDPFDPETHMGPLVSQRQLESVQNYIEIGKQEGGRITTGGGRPRHLERGWFVEPTVFADVDNSHTIAQEEIFGPVLCVIKADDEDHAIAIANDTIYGLNNSVFTHDVEKAYAAARRLRSGTVGHNGPRSDFCLAFGGFKQSGIGREGGHEGIHAFVEVKVIVLDDEPAAICSLPIN